MGFRVWELRIDQVRLVEVAVVPLALVLVRGLGFRSRVSDLGSEFRGLGFGIQGLGIRL